MRTAFGLVLFLTGCAQISVSETDRLNTANFTGMDRSEFVDELSKYGRFVPVASPANSRFWTYKTWVLESSDCFEKQFEPFFFVADDVSICVRKGDTVQEWMTELNFFRGETLITYHPET